MGYLYGSTAKKKKGQHTDNDPHEGVSIGHSTHADNHTNKGHEQNMHGRLGQEPKPGSTHIKKPI
jgi:hypothetical protein